MQTAATPSLLTIPETARILRVHRSTAGDAADPEPPTLTLAGAIGVRGRYPA